MKSLPLTAKGGRVVAVDVLFLVLATIAIGLRMWSRHLKRTGYFAEDYLALNGLIFYYGFSIALYINIALGGVGHPETDLNAQRGEINVRIVLAQEAIYAIGVASAKISICVLLARIFTTRLFRILARILMGIIAAWGLMTILIGFLICRPISVSCAGENSALASVAGINVATDILVIILPQPYVWRLHMKKRQRLALAVLFALGSLSMIMSILRLTVVLGEDFVSDFSSTVTYNYIWTLAEFGTVVIVSCGPLLKPAFNNISPYVTSILRSSRFDSWRRQRGSSGNSTPNARAGAIQLSSLGPTRYQDAKTGKARKNSASQIIEGRLRERTDTETLSGRSDRSELYSGADERTIERPKPAVLV